MQSFRRQFIYDLCKSFVKRKAHFQHCDRGILQGGVKLIFFATGKKDKSFTNPPNIYVIKYTEVTRVLLEIILSRFSGSGVHSKCIRQERQLWTNLETYVDKQENIFRNLRSTLFRITKDIINVTENTIFLLLKYTMFIHGTDTHTHTQSKKATILPIMSNLILKS